MTKEEILKAADEAVDMFKTPIDESDFHVPENITGVSHSSDEYAKVLESETNSVALQCAILHYEKIVERDKDIGAISLHCYMSPYWIKKAVEAELILKELKSRL